MSKRKYPEEVLQISRLGCMKKSRVDSGKLGTVEHIEVWVPEPGTEGSAEPPAAREPVAEGESKRSPA